MTGSRIRTPLCPHEGEIRIGGATEVEVKEGKDRKDRVDDAMHATRAAVEEVRAVASAC